MEYKVKITIIVRTHKFDFIFSACFPEMGTLAMAMNFLSMFFANGFSIPVVKLTKFVGEVIEQRRKNPEVSTFLTFGRNTHFCII